MSTNNDELTAAQKIRQTITGNPFADPAFQHEGDTIPRWLTGGAMPDAWVTFHHAGDQVIVRCAGCNESLGSWPLNDERGEMVAQIIAIRQAGHENHKPANWPHVNIANAGK
jgi:hypothetical protein